MITMVAMSMTIWAAQKPVAVSTRDDYYNPSTSSQSRASVRRRPRPQRRPCWPQLQQAVLNDSGDLSATLGGLRRKNRMSHDFVLFL